jgi:hypothetical protein
MGLSDDMKHDAARNVHLRAYAYLARKRKFVVFLEVAYR